MKVADVMTYRVISVTREATILQAAHLMLRARISGLPVVDSQGKIIGIVTEGDFVRRAELGTERRRSHWLELVTSPGKMAEEFTRSHGRRVAEIMTNNVHTVTEETELTDAVDLMEREGIKRLPVLRDGKLVGMLTRTNLIRGVTSGAHAAKSLDAADWAIREQIIAELRKQPWAPVYAIDVKVRKGIADLAGTIFDERERNALIVSVENTPGVKEVRDHIALLEPNYGLLVHKAV